jgi:hypothetical protein
MMAFALEYRAPIDSITADKSLKLRKHELDNDDWQVIEQLVLVLRRYKTATLYFSSNAASIAAIILAMDTLTDSLDLATNKTLHIAIRAAMGLVRKKMNRYYSLTDDSAVYRIAMGKYPPCVHDALLTPRHYRPAPWAQAPVLPQA